MWLLKGCGGPWSKARESSPRSASPPENRRRNHGSLRNPRDESENAVGWKYRWCEILDTCCQQLDWCCELSAHQVPEGRDGLLDVGSGGARCRVRWCNTLARDCQEFAQGSPDGDSGCASLSVRRCSLSIHVVPDVRSHGARQPLRDCQRPITHDR